MHRIRYNKDIYQILDLEFYDDDNDIKPGDWILTSKFLGIDIGNNTYIKINAIQNKRNKQIFNTPLSIIRKMLLIGPNKSIKDFKVKVFKEDNSIKTEGLYLGYLKIHKNLTIMNSPRLYLQLTEDEIFLPYRYFLAIEIPKLNGRLLGILQMLRYKKNLNKIMEIYGQKDIETYSHLYNKGFEEYEEYYGDKLDIKDSLIFGIVGSIDRK